MIYQVGHVKDILTLPDDTDEGIISCMANDLLFLDREYGVDRDITHDCGGYVLYCLPGTKLNEIEAFFPISLCVPEMSKTVSPDSGYVDTAYILYCDFVVFVFMARDDLKRSSIEKSAYTL